MRQGSEGSKCYHVIWATPAGHPWLKIAGAARFCEHAVHHACAQLGFVPDLVAVFPDRVHLMVTAAASVDRRAVNTQLREVVTRLLRDAHVLPVAPGSPWEGEGWCAALPNAISAAAVRRTLVARLASGAYLPSAGRRHPAEGLNTPAATARP